MREGYEAYLDESYNNSTFCVGGWLAHKKTWRHIEKLWNERIEYERRKSIVKGFPPIRRYHATDCASLQREFARNKGWDETRQIRLTKRIIEIVTSAPRGQARPAGIVFGGGAEDYLRHFVGDKERWREGLYYFSIIRCLIQIADFLGGACPDGRVSIFYERGKFGGMADKAFASLMADPRNNDISKYFVRMVPMGWEGCTALQAADFIAFEGFKRIGSSLKGKNISRRSLQTLLGKQTTLVVGHFSDQSFRKMIERKSAEIQEE